VEHGTRTEPTFDFDGGALSDGDGNAFFIIGTVSKALRNAGVSKDEIESFQSQATLGDYRHLLSTVMEWVEVE